MAGVKGWRVLVLSAAALVTASASAAQTLNPSAREVIRHSRALIDAGKAAVPAAARVAVDRHTFRLSYQPGGPGADIQMGADDKPRYIRMTSGERGQADTVTFLHYARLAARGCDGTTRPGELVREYENKGSAWTVKARTRSALELADAAFDTLAGLRPITS
jgi:hypothetical protein